MSDGLTWLHELQLSLVSGPIFVKHKAMRDMLLQLCGELQLTGDDLDELVHDAAGRRAAGMANQRAEGQAEPIIEDQEALASRVNNEGLPAQIQFLLDCYGDVETRRLLQSVE